MRTGGYSLLQSCEITSELWLIFTLDERRFQPKKIKLMNVDEQFDEHVPIFAVSGNNRQNLGKRKSPLFRDFSWRRERDSNPWVHSCTTRFPVVRLRPTQPSLHGLQFTNYSFRWYFPTGIIPVMRRPTQPSLHGLRLNIYSISPQSRT